MASASSAWTADAARPRPRSRTSTYQPSCAVTADQGLATTPDPGEIAALAAAHDRIRARVADACARAGRDPASVRVLAISKAVPAGRLRAAVAAGVTDLGENRVQEAEAKVAAVRGAHWELVGRLQANKATRAVALFRAIHSVDSVELVQRLDRLAAAAARGGDASRPQLAVFLQVNVDADPAKSGFAPAVLEEALPSLAELARLDLRGLMTVGRLVHAPALARPTFAALRELSVRLRQDVPAFGRELSMGMSDDFEVAVEEGATVVRVGRAIFGTRPAA